MRYAYRTILAGLAIALPSAVWGQAPAPRAQPGVINPALSRTLSAPVAKPAAAPRRPYVTGPLWNPKNASATPGPHELSHTVQQEARRAQSVSEARKSRQQVGNTPIDNFR